MPYNGRSTPTRVGKTRSDSYRQNIPTVHPHACGENDTACKRGMVCIGPPPRVWGKPDRDYFIDRRYGPPPRVWGKHVCVSHGDRCPRSTPTRVGKTIRRVSGGWCVSVHPHACGENGAPYARVPSSLGPPPRVWGKRWSDRDAGDIFRSTPTRVGKTDAVRFDGRIT